MQARQLDCSAHRTAWPQCTQRRNRGGPALPGHATRPCTGAPPPNWCNEQNPLPAAVLRLRRAAAAARGHSVASKWRWVRRLAAAAASQQVPIAWASGGFSRAAKGCLLVGSSALRQLNRRPPGRRGHCQGSVTPLAGPALCSNLVDLPVSTSTHVGRGDQKARAAIKHPAEVHNTAGAQAAA